MAQLSSTKIYGDLFVSNKIKTNELYIGGVSFNDHTHQYNSINTGITKPSTDYWFKVTEDTTDVKKIEIRDKESNYVDILYPKTSKDMVVGLDEILENKLDFKILDGIDFNEMDTPGAYRVTNNIALTNGPVNVAGFLTVSKGINDNFIIQHFTSQLGLIYSRISQDFNGVKRWGPWATAFTSSKKPSKSDVGLSNVNNWAASADVDSTNGDTTYATISAVKSVKDVVATNICNGTIMGSLRSSSSAVEDSSYKLGMAAVALGNGTQASGMMSFAAGGGPIASGQASTAFGNTTQATASNSFASGSYSIASGPASYAHGEKCTASGANSFATGGSAVASGIYSYARGRVTTAETYGANVIGQYNKVNSGNASSYSATQNALVIGNGATASSPSNSFRVTYDGKTYGLSAFNSSGADYAEYFEWADGNPNNEDRIGRFVTLEGKKIRLANSEDDYIVGIMSGAQSMIGNSYEDSWQGMYMTDEFGRYIYEDIEVEVPSVEEDVEPQIVTERHIKLNPVYTSEKEYLPRSQRKEWDVVGMLGQIVVRDDGTCQVNKTCMPGVDGIATASERGYRVLERISKNLILVLFK